MEPGIRTIFDARVRKQDQAIDSAGRIAGRLNRQSLHYPVGDEKKVTAYLGAIVGQACFNPGEAKNTYGTGCFMLEIPATS